MRVPFPAAVLAASLAACAAEPRPAPSPAARPADPTRYACDDGAFLSVRFGADAADVILVDGSTVTLPGAPAASGFRYGSATYDLAGKGDAARWTAGSSPPTACIAT